MLFLKKNCVTGVTQRLCFFRSRNSVWLSTEGGNYCIIHFTICLLKRYLHSFAGEQQRLFSIEGAQCVTAVIKYHFK